MLTFKHILFPVDLSKQCEDAAPFVKAMAVQFGADITMLHVMDFPPYWYGTMGAESFGAMVDMPKLTEERKLEFDRFLNGYFTPTPVRRIVEQGDPALVIADYCEASNVDLVMMPTHGYGPFRRLLLGSVTAKVLHDAKCPVWTGVHAEQAAAHPSEVRSMMCAVDLSAESLPLIKWAAELADVYHAKLRLVHAVPGHEVRPNKYFDSEMDKFLKELAREEISKLQKEAGTSFEVCMERGEIPHVIREAALHHEVDLLVTGRGVLRRTLGSLRTDVYAIIRDAPCPVISA